MISQIKALAKIHRARMVQIRRHLHKHPELSFEEYKTAEYVKVVLDDLGIVYKEGLGSGTGITGVIGQGDRTIALRADMDALPIQEESDVAYRSVHDGVMHACGHDVHTASLLGSLMILKSLEKDLGHKVKFIFQPGEEQLPGGASMMIADGALQNPQVAQIYGQHVHPSLPVGKIGYHPGFFMASCDELFITVIGQGGHGAMPHETIDPIMICAELIQSLQTIISRNANPNTPSVLSIGKINSDGGATNVIPSKVMMEGTFRTFDEDWRKQAHQLIEQRIHHVVKSYGAQVELEIKKGYPSLYNDPSMTYTARDLMIEYMGAEHVIELPQRMTAEDYSYYSQVVPACFYRLGTASPDGTKNSPVHTPTFDIDEDALEISSGLMAWLALH